MEAFLIAPTYKKGDICDIGTYCLISLLSNISKLLEKIVNVQVRNYLNEQKIIAPDQHGFVKGFSCETTLVNLSSRLFSSRDKGLYLAIAALDFTKAYDTANHGIILNKLCQLVFDASSHDWFRFYLCDRTQSVRYAGCLSQPLSVLTGVSKGCMISPFMFIIYINLSMLLLSSSILAYVNNVTLVAQGQMENDTTQALQSLVNQVIDWCTTNCLNINPTKGKWMVILPVLRP